jgi:hypothetical protein
MTSKIGTFRKMGVFIQAPAAIWYRPLLGVRHGEINDTHKIQSTSGSSAILPRHRSV